MKVTAQALGQTMSTLVVQERHLWLTLADMRETDKHRFIDSPISQAGLFGEVVEDFAQQFSTTQKQTEAFQHILPQRSSAVSTQPPAAAPPSACHPGHPLAASTSAPVQRQQQPSQRLQCGAGRRSSWILLFRRWLPHHSFPQRRAGRRIFCFLFVLLHRDQNLKKEAVSFSSGSQEGKYGGARRAASTPQSPSPFASDNILAQSDLVPRTNAPRDSPSFANSSEEGSPFSERGHPLAPVSRIVESPHMVPGWDTEDRLPPAVVNTITSARAPSTRNAYRLKWNLFVEAIVLAYQAWHLLCPLCVRAHSTPQ